MKVNLPAIAPGDLLYLQAVYARGCIDCVVGGAWVLGGGSAAQGGFPGTNGRFGFNTADGVLNPLLNEITLVEGVGRGRGLPALLDPATAFGLPACL